MSTLSVTPTAPATRLRITARGRRVLAALVALPIAALLAITAFHAVPSAVASSEQGEVASFETITVLPGDTLWSIAGEIAPGHDRRDVVDALVRLNVLGGGAIFAGQELAIPVQYAGSTP